MGISSAVRQRKKGEAGRPFRVDKREPRRGDLTSSSAESETKKEEEAPGPFPVVKQQDVESEPCEPAFRFMPKEIDDDNKLQYSERDDRQVKKVVSCSVSHSEKEPPAPLANNKNDPAAKCLPCDLLRNKVVDSEPYKPALTFMPKEIDDDKGAQPTRVNDFERLEQLAEPNRVPVYLLTGSRIVNKILGRDPANQCTQAAFQSEGLDPHASAKGFQRTGCPTFPDTSIPFDKDEYLFERTFTLGELLEGMEDIHQLILRKKEINPKANVNSLWRLLDAKVDICRKIKKEIAAARGSSQEIPHYMIR